MYDNSSELTRIEIRLNRILEIYSQARVRGDFYEATLAVHTALEDALNVRLEEQDRNLPFSEKFERVLPGLFRSHSVDQLNKQRNFLSHPKQTFGDAEVRKTAIAFVDLAIAAWPSLFGHSAPAVTHPGTSTGDATMDAALWYAGRSPEQLARPAGEPPTIGSSQPAGRGHGNARASAWRALVLALLSLLALPLLIGFASFYWRHQPIIWHWVLIPMVLAAILGFSFLRNLWRFLRGVGLRRLAMAVSVGAVLATLALVPFTPKEADLPTRVGIALTRLLSSVERFVGSIASGIPALGANLASEIAPSTSTPVVVPMVTMEPTRAPWTATPEGTGATMKSPQQTAPPATPTVSSQPTPVLRPTPTQAGSIAIGARVRVKTDGAPLMSRAGPGKAKDVVARFDNGSELTVIEGPTTADGLTWWKVQGQAGTGWSAADFLEAIAAR